MQNFKVHTNEILYYCEKDVKAKNKKEAEEKYFEMMANGDVEVNKNSYCDIVVLGIDEAEPIPQKTIFIMTEFIGETGSWEWYAINKNITPQEAIKNYLIENDIKEESELKEEFDKNLTRNGNVYYDTLQDVRAYEITIN